MNISCESNRDIYQIFFTKLINNDIFSLYNGNTTESEIENFASQCAKGKQVSVCYSALVNNIWYQYTFSQHVVNIGSNGSLAVRFLIYIRSNEEERSILLNNPERIKFIHFLFERPCWFVNKYVNLTEHTK